MSRHVDFLPVGSVITAKKSEQPLMIVKRCVDVKIKNKLTYFDYGVVAYPLGLIRDEVYYLNHDDIIKVLFYGLDDDSNKKLVKIMNESLDKPNQNIGLMNKIRRMMNHE